jgi:hypothetical protein
MKPRKRRDGGKEDEEMREMKGKEVFQPISQCTAPMGVERRREKFCADRREEREERREKREERGVA